MPFYLLAVILLLTGCQSTRYYAQAARGQFAILAQRESIEDLLAAPDTPDALRTQLQLVLEVRRFAQDQLQLPVGKSYTSYVELGREHVVWNVFAAPEFSLEPQSWCYPFAGCANYRGYFAKADAERFAKQLEERHNDVYVAGIDAYSTLGWFDDPILSSIASYPPPLLASVLFHELAHKLLYVKGDSAFNESFATVVEEIGLERWLKEQGQPTLREDAKRRHDRKQAFVALVSQTRNRLEALYASGIAPNEMRAEKRTIFEDLRTQYRQLRESWGGYAGYDAWFEEPLNNAKLDSVSIYHDYVPALLALLDAKHGDLPAFYEACRKLASEPADERRRALEARAETS